MGLLNVAILLSFNIIASAFFRQKSVCWVALDLLLFLKSLLRNTQWFHVRLLEKQYHNKYM